MRIALLTELYPPSLGGQERFFEGLGKTLHARGHEVEVLCIAHAAGLAPDERQEGIRIRRHPVAAGYTTPAWSWMRRRWGAILRYALWTRREVATGRFDLILLNQWPLLHAALLPRGARERAVLHWCEVRSDPFHAAIQRALPRATGHNAAVSDAVATAIGQASGRPLFALPSGLELARYRPHRPEMRSGILSLGRIVPHKNHALLLSAFEQLRARGYPGRLLIAGDGPAMEALRALCAAAEAIELLGAVDEEAKLALLATSALLMVTSRREGFPRAVAEAMASGLPVVTTDDPGNGTRDIVEASGCGVVAAADPMALAIAAEQALASREALAAAGLRHADRLDWHHLAAALESRLARVAP
jgi:glycosyltransferase involved in cell wall biosynthesis